MRGKNPPDVDAQRPSCLRTLAGIFAVAILVNYPWELAQSPLYMGMESINAVWWHCFVASLGDGLLVLLIFAVGWLALGKQNWYWRPRLRGYLLMFVVGLAIGVGVEWLAVHTADQWAYTARMPLVPWLGIGIAPVMQLLVLPPLIFRAVAAWTRSTPANARSEANEL